MQMSINFKKLFNFQQSSHHTPNTTSLQNSYHIDEPSIISNESNNINIHYKFNEGLFFDTTIQGDQKTMNILGDLSSIGRSFQQDDYEQKFSNMKLIMKQQQQSSKHNHKNFKNNPYSQFKSNKKGQVTFYLNQKDTSKTPGQRLYYESKIQNQRKLKQLQRIKLQLQQQQAKQTTFKPSINQKSKKILQLADSPLRKMQNMKKSQKQQKTIKQLKSTVQRKQEQELKNCTFKPTILKTPKSLIPSASSRSSNKDLSNVFQSLYNQHRAKIQRKRKLLQEQQYQKKQKTMTKQQLQQFFNRNQQYIEEKKNRQQLLKAVSSQYDLTSGRKLFQPKINSSSSSLSGPLVNSLSMAKFNSSQQRNVNKQKNNSSPKNNLSLNNNKKKLSNKKNNNNSNNSKKLMIQQGRNRPLPYQVSKFVSEQQDGNNYDRQLVDNRIQGQNNRGGLSNYSDIIKGKSSIFNKGVISQQLQQQTHQQYERQSQQLQQSENQIGQDDNDVEQIEQHQQQQDGNISVNNFNRQQQQQQQQQQQVYGNDNNEMNQIEQQFKEQNISNEQQNHQHQVIIDQHYQSQRSLPEQPQQPLFSQHLQNNHPQLNKQHSNSMHSQQQCHSKDEDKSEQNHYQQQLRNQSIQQSIKQAHQQLEQQYQHKSHQSHQQQQQHQQYQQQQQPQSIQMQRKQSQDDDITKRTNFLQSIVKNPIYTHKYPNLFSIHQTQHQYIDNQKQQRQFNTQNHSTSNQHSSQLLHLTSTNTNTNQAPTQLPLLLRPIFLSKDSQQQQNQQKPTPKSWHQIFHSSTTFQKAHNNITPSQSGFSQRSRISQLKNSSNLSPEQSPKKKSINIASLLKAKKKQLPTKA